VVSKSVHMISAVVKPVLGIGGVYPGCRGASGFFQQVAGVGRAQPGFELAKGECKGVEIGEK